MPISVLYTGWLQDRLKTSQDDVDACDGITFTELAILLSGLSPTHKELFGYKDIIYFSQAERIQLSSDRVDSAIPVITFSPIAGG